ncbi:uncharacterized protein (DUF2267 family) [Caulobacter ginsengisoli]|uniref:Uncharacterized protein (DUF2267 family) n=1 Tax=Caulobacter ginsengisoli TaxID=400775 RepID=A0ABU0J046_9CAUL|nr:DUF2267 domain-containing protein [Caulobacter ginsengisoli]MDQ0466980.1 uncharacterized protein (DUF2267 family) [Caulobacter ginsengisoli]
MNTGLAVFDTTVQQSNLWLKAIEAALPPCSRQEAYDALRAGLHTLRDHLPQDAVLGLSGQLPMLLRGLYLEGWRPGHPAPHTRDAAKFAADLASRLPPGFPRPGEDVARAVFAVAAGQLDAGEIRKLIDYLPAPLRTFWPGVYWAV